MSETEASPVIRSAKEIPDDLFIRAVAECSKASAWGNSTSWATRYDVEVWLSEHLGGPVPWKVVVAKARAVIKKGRMEGCTCGCRGDFDLRGYPDDPWAAAQTSRPSTTS